MLNTHEIINLPYKPIDLTDVEKILGEFTRIDSFKEFIKGHEFENEFKDYEEITKKDMD